MQRVFWVGMLIGTGCVLGCGQRDNEWQPMMQPSRGGGGGIGGDDAGPAPESDAAQGSGGAVTPDEMPDGAAPPSLDLSGMDLAAGIVVGGQARVTADSLNLRTGPGTNNMVITAMPCGSRVDVIGGPSMGWWNVRYNGTPGWSSGKYLVADSAFDPAVCAMGGGGDAAMANGGGDGGMPGEVADIFTRCKEAVGYSYYWGHGSWRSDGQQIGSCMGNCGQCTHTGPYGADCSGLVAKCWQVPTPSPITTDLHPYSTYNFFNQTTHWAPVPRTSIHPADSLVYNANGAGHMVLFESGMDPWGNLWVYEARGCATGVVHDLRAFSAAFITIRREGL